MSADERQELTDSMVTVADGRAVLGVASQVFARAYVRAGNLSAGGVFGTGDVRGEAIGLLDQANGYAQRIYSELTALPNAALIDATSRAKVAECLREAEQALALIDAQAASTFWSDLITAAKTVIVGVAQGLGFVAKTVTQGVFNLSPAVFVAGALAIVAAVYFASKRIA